jgi:hypothetical protein
MDASQVYDLPIVLRDDNSVASDGLQDNGRAASASLTHAALN